jgi:molybdopterin synthase catalytic subunit
MTTLQVRLFATLKDRAGDSRIAVPIATPTTVSELCAAIGAQYPALASSLTSALVAVNREYAFADTEIQAGDEIAIFPPVSGGEEAVPHPTMFAVTTEAVDLNAVAARLTEPDVGAIVFFHGSVRGATSRSGLPAETIYLEYEA